MRLERIDEGVCDDWLMALLLAADDGLAAWLGDGVELQGTELRHRMEWLVRELKDAEAIAFRSLLVGSGIADTVPEEELDVAQALVDGSVAKLVKKSHKKGGDKKAKGVDAGKDDEDEDVHEVPHPTDGEAEPLRVGPVRHRYLEPLFLPSLLRELKPSVNDAARRLGMDEYETSQEQYAGVHEVVGLVVAAVADAEQKKPVWESVVVVSSGKISGIKGAVFLLLCWASTNADEEGPKQHSDRRSSRSSRRSASTQSRAQRSRPS